MRSIDSFINLDVLVKHRGLVLRPAGTELRVLVRSAVGSNMFELVREITDPGPAARTAAIDAVWTEIYQLVTKYEYASWDGVSWEVHGIIDPELRAEATEAYLTNKSQ